MEKAENVSPRARGRQVTLALLLVGEFIQQVHIAFVGAAAQCIAMGPSRLRPAASNMGAMSWMFSPMPPQVLGMVGAQS